MGAIRISARQEAIIESLMVFGGRAREWARPMDIGARDGSGHTALLKRLIDVGIVERRLRGSLLNQIRGTACYEAWSKVKKRGRSAPRGSYVYRLTAKGYRIGIERRALR